MAKVKVPVFGTVGKTIFFDPQAGERAEAAVEALAQAISLGVGGTIVHSALQGLQVGDDHPQYAMWQAPETIQGQWNFATVPNIQGESLAEYIEDVVGGSFFDFLQDTPSVVWTYHETANELEANVPPEFVQDTVGAMLADSTSIDFTYDDSAGTFTASTINANPTGTIGLTAVNGTAATPMRSDGAPALSQAIAPSWSANHTWLDNARARFGTGNDLSIYHDGTDTFIDNDTGLLVVSSPVVVRFLTNFNQYIGDDTEFYIKDNTGGVDMKTWRIVATNDTLSIGPRADNDTAGPTGLSFTRSGNTIPAVRIPTDATEFHIGAGSDLRLYHDGTNSFVRNDTGELRLQFSTTVSAAIEATAAFDMRQQIQRSNVISPAQLTANTDNYSPTGLSTASTLRLSTDASRNLTGIAAQPAGTEITICNIGSQDLVLVHNATSTAANQFLCPGSANFTLNANDSVRIWYDTTSSRWRVIES